MNTASVATGLITSSPYLMRMALSLFWMYLTLGRRVSKTRKAFERQLIQQGISTKDARQMSTCFKDLKDDITAMLREGVRFSGS